MRQHATLLTMASVWYASSVSLQQLQTMLANMKIHPAFQVLALRVMAIENSIFVCTCGTCDYGDRTKLVYGEVYCDLHITTALSLILARSGCMVAQCGLCCNRDRHQNYMIGVRLATISVNDRDEACQNFKVPTPKQKRAVDSLCRAHGFSQPRFYLTAAGPCHCQ